MDSRDLKRISSGVKESNSFDATLKQLSHDISVRQNLNDASLNEIQRDFQKMASDLKRCKSCQEITDKNTNDICFLKNEVFDLKETVSDLKRRNEKLELFNIELLKEVKQLASNNVSTNSEHFMKTLVSISNVADKIMKSNSSLPTEKNIPHKECQDVGLADISKSDTCLQNEVRCKNDGCSTQKLVDEAPMISSEDKTDNPSSNEFSIDLNIENPVSENKILENMDFSSEIEGEIESKASKDTDSDKIKLSNSSEKVDEQTVHGVYENIDSTTVSSSDQDKLDKPLVYQMSETHGSSGSKSLRISIAPTEMGTSKSLTKSSKSSSLCNLSRTKKAKLSRKSSIDNDFPGSSMQCASKLASVDELDWPDTDKILGEIDVIQRERASTLNISTNSESKTKTKMNDEGGIKNLEEREQGASAICDSDNPPDQFFRKTNEQSSLKVIDNSDRGHIEQDHKTMPENFRSDVMYRKKNKNNRQFSKELVSNCCPDKEQYEKNNGQSEEEGSSTLLESNISPKEETTKQEVNINPGTTNSNKNSKSKSKRKRKHKASETKMDEENGKSSSQIKLDENVAEISPTLESSVESINKSDSTKTVASGSSESDSNNENRIRDIDGSVLSPEAKEFAPTREYGKAKLTLATENLIDSQVNTKCPKLTNARMDQEEEAPDPRGTCINCGTQTIQRCANCRQVFYCKRDCQRIHWKSGHKDVCKPYKIEKNSHLGRYMIATRDFKAGDVIFKDDPLIVGPKQVTEPLCLGCYKRVDGSYRCRKCTWPLCGPACESSPDHIPECVVGKEIGSPIDISDFSEANHFYEVVSTLRGLTLKKRAPKKYAELLTLENHFEDRKGSDVFHTNQKRVVNMLRNYFMLVDFPPDDIDASEGSIHQMTGIIDVNAVDFPIHETEIQAVYPVYSILEHSCTPNTKYKVSSNKQITVSAAVNIRKGENLSTIYTHMLWGTAGRRDNLKSTRYFMCTCRRCADPTELGTNFSALRCQKCPIGFLMSAAPLDQLADWICTTCNSTISADEANEITLNLGEEVERVLASSKLEEIERLIERISSTIVHPNHFHLFAARHSLLQMLGRGKEGLNENAVKKKETMCQEFLKTCTALDPGMAKLAPYAGVALYEYHLAVLARARQGPTDQQVDKAALRKDLDTAKALLQQCIKVLMDEPDISPECQLRHLAQQNLIELDQWASPIL